jgi:hypothetical protein
MQPGAGWALSGKSRELLATKKAYSPENEKSEARKSCRARTRSYQNELEQQARAKAASQIDSQALQDPLLARVVQAWPHLSEERKKIIGSLLSVS